jgi:hypothetical protein
VEFRLAERADLHQVGRLGDRASRAAYAEILDAASVAAGIASEHSARALRAEIDKGAVVVCESEPGLLAGFAVFESGGDHLHIRRVFADPIGGTQEQVISGLLSWARVRDPRLAVSTDITLGSVAHETASRHLGFSPGEVVPSPTHGTAVVDRRWWAPPLAEELPRLDGHSSG